MVRSLVKIISYTFWWYLLKNPELRIVDPTIWDFGSTKPWLAVCLDK